MLYVWGCGKFGQHGKGTLTNISPEDGIIEELKHDRVKLVACGASHTLVFTEKQKLFGWGNNANGQLGYINGKHENEKCKQPKLIETEHVDITGIACGNQHSYIWTKDGVCMRFGEDYMKDIIQDSREMNGVKWAESSPKEKWTLRGCKVKQVACGTRHALFCTNDGITFACGANNRGQLGTGSRRETNTPKKVTGIHGYVTQVACGSFHSICLTDEGQVYHWGYGSACGCNENIFTPTRVDDLDRITKVAAGDSHSLALSADGKIFAWGSNSKGQFGKGLGYHLDDEPVNLTNLLKIPPCIDIASRDDMTAAILQSGSLLLWGNNIWDVLSGGISMNSFIRSPFSVNLNQADISQIALGSWHVAAITSCNLTREHNKHVQNEYEILRVDENSPKEACDVPETTGRQIDNNNNNTLETPKGMLWARKEHRSFRKQYQRQGLESKGLLVDLESQVSENESDKVRKTHENLEMNEDLKQLCVVSKIKDRSTIIDFAIESVNRENNVTFAPLKPKSSKSMSSFYIRRPQTFKNNQTNRVRGRMYAGVQSSWTNRERGRYSHSAGGKDVRSWEAHKAENFQQPGQQHTEVSEAKGICSVANWNTELLLDMTTKFHQKHPIAEYGDQHAKKTTTRKEQNDEYVHSAANNRKQKGIVPSYLLQTLELPKLRRNENWKRSTYMRSFANS